MTPSEKQKIALALLVVPLFLVVMGFATGGLAALPEGDHGVRLAVRDVDGDVRCSLHLSTRHLPAVVFYGGDGERAWSFPEGAALRGR